MRRRGKLTLFKTLQLELSRVGVREGARFKAGLCNDPKLRNICLEGSAYRNDLRQRHTAPRPASIFASRWSYLRLPNPREQCAMHSSPYQAFISRYRLRQQLTICAHLGLNALTALLQHAQAFTMRCRESTCEGCRCILCSQMAANRASSNITLFSQLEVFYNYNCSLPSR